MSDWDGWKGTRVSAGMPGSIASGTFFLKFVTTAQQFLYPRVSSGHWQAEPRSILAGHIWGRALLLTTKSVAGVEQVRRLVRCS